MSKSLIVQKKRPSFQTQTHLVPLFPFKTHNAASKRSTTKRSAPGSPSQEAAEPVCSRHTSSITKPSHAVYAQTASLTTTAAMPTRRVRRARPGYPRCPCLVELAARSRCCAGEHAHRWKQPWLVDLHVEGASARKSGESMGKKNPLPGVPVPITLMNGEDQRIRFARAFAQEMVVKARKGDNQLSFPSLTGFPMVFISFRQSDSVTSLEICLFSKPLPNGTQCVAVIPTLRLASYDMRTRVTV